MCVWGKGRGGVGMLRCIFWGRVLFTFSVLIAASFALMRAHLMHLKSSNNMTTAATIATTRRRQFLFGLAKTSEQLTYENDFVKSQADQTQPDLARTENEQRRTKNGAEHLSSLTHFRGTLSSSFNMCCCHCCCCCCRCCH